MARIDGIKIQNYKTLRDVTLGKLWNGKGKPLTDLTVVIGRNGAGKSSLFDVFGFLADCLNQGVEEACDMRQRGGFDKLISKDQEGPIHFEILYRESSHTRPITYELSIGKDDSGRPYVEKERLLQSRESSKRGRPMAFLDLRNGAGQVWNGEYTENDRNHEDGPDESNVREDIEFNDTRRLAIATLGTLRQHPRIARFRSFISGWYLSYFSPNAARQLGMSGAHPHLNTDGNNLGNVVQYMERQHGAKFKKILHSIAEQIPGISNITTKTTEDGRLLLCFHSEQFKTPFYAHQMSDGTLKLFAYLLLMNDPDPHPLLCIEEPENGLYVQLFEPFIQELKRHTSQRKDFQAFVTTHQPYLVDALVPEEVWILKKGEDGFTSVSRASDMPLVPSLVEEELPLGALWYSHYLDA